MSVSRPMQTSQHTGTAPHPTPMNLSSPVDDAWVKGKTILITGGASGFGESFTRAWTLAGATVIIGDIDVAKGDKLVKNLRQESGNQHVYFFYCDVTDWLSQVSLFKSALRVSPHGGIDAVVANAGIADKEPAFFNPVGLDSAAPPPPDLKVLDVNITGVMYTVHLALYWLPRNPQSSPASPRCDSATLPRDRHLLLLSSLAGLAPLPSQIPYTVSKHAVVGLFRSLRSVSFAQGVRVNMICPYFVETPILRTGARIMLAGVPKARIEDVVEAATRFVSQPDLCGRAVIVGHKVKVNVDENGEWTFVDNQKGQDRAIFEVFAEDHDESEMTTRRLVAVINLTARLKGWTAVFSDIVSAIRYAVGL